MKKPIIIAVAGGTASGKTTVVSEIEQALKSDKLSVIYMDNYYKQRDDLSMEERKLINYDHPDSFDIDLLYEDLKKLLNNQAINSPVYNFTLHNRDSNKRITINPSSVIIIEGILTLYDERIRDLADISIYVESDSDIRFIRRLRRDIKERGRTMDDVIKQYLSTVKPMYDAYVAPTKRFADIIIPNDNKHDVALAVISSKIKDSL